VYALGMMPTMEFLPIGPLAAAVIVIGLAEGRAGYKAWGRRIIRWRVGWGWSAVALLLPAVLVGPAPRAAKFGLAQVVQYTFDTTLGIGSVLMSGVLDRFPGLKLVLSHGGGAYPYLAGRFDIMHRRMDRAAQGDVAAKLPSAYATQMAYDSIVHAPKALRFLIDVVGLDNVVLGTDYSFPPADMEPLAHLRSAGLSAAEIDAIADANPRRVFARLR
jgi:aminocarboxymuconate-semialdehyde decarboxylase